jgi:hypothetical protein
MNKPSSFLTLHGNSRPSVSRKLLLLKAIFLLLLFLTVNKSKAQTTIIDSTTTTGGSFENGTSTFAANGWTNVNGVTNKWFVGTVASCTGSKGAYIGTASGNNAYTINTSDISHFYRTVAFPAGETCINLSFNWKANGEVGYDGIKIFLGSVGGSAPVANTPFTNTDGGAVQIGASFYEVQTSCIRVAINIPAAYAGTTRRLVFSWVNDNSVGGAVGATVDNIGLYSSTPAVPSCAGSYVPANLASGITPCNPVLSWTPAASSTCNAPAMYYIYFGPVANPPLIDSTTSLSYRLGSLSASTPYFWKVVPKNNAGLATGCTESTFTTSAASCTASPGGVGLTNITSWFRSDGLAIGNLTSWTTNYPSGGSAITVTDPSSPYSQVTNSDLDGTNDFNYNQYISFANNNVTAGNQRFLYSTGNYNLMTNSNVSTDQSSFFAVSKNRAGGLNDAIVYWGTSSGNYGLQCRGIARMAIGANLGNNTSSSRDPGSLMVSSANVFSYTGNRSTATSMTAYYNGTIVPSGTASESSGAVGLSIGAHLATSTPTFIEPFQGALAEQIFVNSTLSARAVERVHTYTAIKYGITLSTNYISSADHQVYATTAPYNNNIIGIGRDDASNLLQKQSHSTDDTVRIYTSTLTSTNAANSGSFASDKSFVMMGANTGLLRATTSSNTAMPTGIFSRLERQWRVTKTNYSQTFSIDIKLSAGANPWAVEVSDLRLLVDNAGDFSSATIYAAGGGLTFSYNYPVITISGISDTHIPNNSSRTLTIGSVDPMTPLPLTLVSFTGSCQNHNVVLKWTTVSETGINNFAIQRSTDGVHFSTLEHVAANNNNSDISHYNFSDKDITQAAYFYRLKITDQNGMEKYSSTILTKDCAGVQNNLAISPNPVIGNRVNLEYTASGNEVLQVKFENTFGQNCLTKTVQVQAGKNLQAIDLGNIASGIYFMHVTSSASRISKVIKLVIKSN